MGRRLTNSVTTTFVVFVSFVVVYLFMPITVVASELVSIGNHVDTTTDSYGPDISADGRYVTFTAYVKGLEGKDGYFVAAVFRRDMERGITTLVSRSLDNQTASGSASDSVISANGRYIAYSSKSDKIIKNDTNSTVDVFVWDAVDNVTRRANVSSNGEQANAITYEAYLSSDGRYVLFNTQADNLLGEKDKGNFNTHVRDLVKGKTFRADITADGVMGNGSSEAAFMTSDGCCVVELNSSTNLFTESNTFDSSQVVLWRLKNKMLEAVSVNTAGEFSNNDVFRFAVDGTGRYVVFESRADNLGVDADGTEVHLFVRDMKKKKTRYLNVNRFDQQGIYDGYELAGRRSMSDDGRYLVMLASRKKKRFFLDAAYDLLVYDLVRDHVKPVVSVTKVNGFDYGDDVAAISGNGRYIVYASDATTTDIEKARHNINKIYRVKNPLID